MYQKKEVNSLNQKPLELAIVDEFIRSMQHFIKRAKEIRGSYTFVEGLDAPTEKFLRLIVQPLFEDLNWITYFEMRKKYREVFGEDPNGSTIRRKTTTLINAGYMKSKTDPEDSRKNLYTLVKKLE